MAGSNLVRFWAIVLAILVIIAGGVMSLFGMGASDDEYGQLRLPGSTTLHLPAGQVDLTFAEDTDNQTFDVPAELHIAITPVGGGPALPVTEVDGSNVAINGVMHSDWGYVVVPRDGEYQVDVPDEITPSIPDPKLMFGPDVSAARWILRAAGIAAVLLLVALVAHRMVRRAGGPKLIVVNPPPEPGQPVPDSVPDSVQAWLYVTGVNGAPPPYLGLGPVRVSGEIRRDPQGVEGPSIPVRDHELTAPTAHWPQVGATLPIWLTRGDSVHFVVLWDAPAATHD